jgi:hypothetical protein
MGYRLYQSIYTASPIDGKLIDLLGNRLDTIIGFNKLDQHQLIYRENMVMSFLKEFMT